MHVLLRLVAQTCKKPWVPALASAIFATKQAVTLITSKKNGMSCATDPEDEHVAFSSAHKMCGAAKNVTNKCSEQASRVGARRSRIKGHRFQLETIPLRRRTPHRPLQPWGD